MNFYDQVLREIVAAIGAALLFGNGYALLRRRSDAKKGARSGSGGGGSSGRATKTTAKSSTGRATGSTRTGEDLVAAPIGRTLAFMLLGAVMLIAGVAALTAL